MTLSPGKSKEYLDVPRGGGLFEIALRQNLISVLSNPGRRHRRNSHVALPSPGLQDCGASQPCCV
jgi:hypothetical protein